MKVLSSFHYSPLLLSHSSHRSLEREGVLPLIHLAAVETALAVSQSVVALNENPEDGDVHLPGIEEV